MKKKFNPAAELAIPRGTPTNETHAEIETTTSSRNKNKTKTLQTILCFSLIKSLFYFF